MANVADSWKKALPWRVVDFSAPSSKSPARTYDDCESGGRSEGVLLLLAGIVGYVTLFVILLFLPAGTLHWWRAWAFIVILFAARVIGDRYVGRVNESLLAERRKRRYMRANRSRTEFSSSPSCSRGWWPSLHSTYSGLTCCRSPAFLFRPAVSSFS